MKVVFWDRKNDRQVTNEELKPIKFVEYVVCCDPDEEGEATGRRICPISGFWVESYEEFLELCEQKMDMEMDWSKWIVDKRPKYLYPKEKLIACLGYKSEKCGEALNWDLTTTVNELVFLRLEV